LWSGARNRIDHRARRGKRIVDEQCHGVEAVVLERQPNPLLGRNRERRVESVDNVAAKPTPDQQTLVQVQAEGVPAINQPAFCVCEPRDDLNPDAGQAKPWLGAGHDDAALRPGEMQPNMVDERLNAEGLSVASPDRAIGRDRAPAVAMMADELPHRLCSLPDCDDGIA